MADTINLPIDERKLRAFVELEKKVQKLKADKDAAEKAQDKAQGVYNNARQAALQGMADWNAVGPAHIEVMKGSLEMEKLTAAQSAATSDLQNGRAVLVEEVIKAARVVAG